MVNRRGRKSLYGGGYRQPKIYRSSIKKKNELPKFSFGKFKLFFLFPAIVVALIYWVFISSFFEIKDIQIEGNNIVSSERILAAVPNNWNIFLKSSGEIENAIYSQIPEIRNVQVYRGLPDTIKLVVVEYEKSLVFESGKRKYLISSQGFVFADVTNSKEETVGLPLVVDKSNVPITISKEIVSPNFVAFLNNIYDNLYSVTNIKPDYFSITETTVDVNLFTKAGFFVKFDSMRSSKKQLDDLKRVLIDKKSEIKEYVDLRVAGWAYYK